MAKKVQPLTDTAIKNAKAKKTTGGTYPAVSLKDARVKRDELKNKVLNGIDPIQEKKALKAIIEAKEIEVQTALATQFHLITYELVSYPQECRNNRYKAKKSF